MKIKQIMLMGVVAVVAMACKKEETPSPMVEATQTYQLVYESSTIGGSDAREPGLYACYKLVTDSIASFNTNNRFAGIYSITGEGKTYQSAKDDADIRAKLDFALRFDQASEKNVYMQIEDLFKLFRQERTDRSAQIVSESGEMTAHLAYVLYKIDNISDPTQKTKMLYSETYVFEVKGGTTY